MLGGLGFVLGLALFPLLSFDGLPPLAIAVVVALPVVFWMYLAAGLIAWWRRPRNSVGLLLVWTGMGVWMLGIANTTVPAFQLVGTLFSTIFGALVHLLLAFPTGRLSSMHARALVIGTYFVATALRIPRYLFDPPTESPGWTFQGVFGAVQLVAITLLSVAVAVVLMARLARARQEHRRTLGAVYGYGTFVVVFVPLITWAFSAWWPSRTWCAIRSR